MNGNAVVAKSLAAQGLEHCFGIVGIPVIELGGAVQQEGINYYGCRNEQGASYSAQAVGYLTGKPGICLAVSGPGMVHAVAGLANAWSNGWPMILLAGASSLVQDGKGSFQECNQMSLAQTYCKFSHKCTNIKQIPFIIEKAIKYSIQGRPGPVYVELPDDVLTSTVDPTKITFPPPVQEVLTCQTSSQKVNQALLLLQQAKNPLVLIGKGAAYGRAEKELTDFIDATNYPFLPTPMGKGVVSDLHPNCVGPARSTALGKSDVILLVGARLNWILHFGQHPRFQKDVKIIQIDICPEEFDNNVRGALNILGDCKQVIGQLNQAIKSFSNFQIFPSNSPWWKTLQQKVEKNRKVSHQLMTTKAPIMNHYTSLHVINQHMPKNAIYVGEGANTMDIGRTIIPQTHPRTKLDAGTFGTMGIGIPFAIAAQVVNPKTPVVAILGDSAFGFSAMELETATRYDLPLVIFILNNNGIFFGNEEIPSENRPINLTPNSLQIQTRYEKMTEAFGGKGIFVKTTEELDAACKEVFSGIQKLYVVNVMIDPMGARKPQEHSWITKGDDEVAPKL